MERSTMQRQDEGRAKMYTQFDRARRHQHQPARTELATVGHDRLTDMVRACDPTFYVRRPDLTRPSRRGVVD